MLLPLAGQVWAQESLQFKHLTINDGLSQNTAYCMVQDNKGFIWIGTDFGLNRYDGYEFISYQNDPTDSTSLSDNRVNTIYEDSDGNLWVGTANGLNVFNREKETFHHYSTRDAYPSESSEFITSIIQDSHGTIWIGTYEGLKYLNQKTRKFSFINLLGTELESQSKSDKKVHFVFEDKDKVIWAGIANTIQRIDPVNKRMLPVPTAIEAHTEWGKTFVRVMRQDHSGNFWFGTEGKGLFKYHVAQNILMNFRHSEENTNTLVFDQVRNIFVASASQLWVGTREGLSILNTETNSFSNFFYDVNNPASLSHNSVWSFLRDKAGSIWVGTFAGGIDVMHPSSKNFTTIREKTANSQGLNHRVLSSVIEDAPGNLWIGTEGGGLNHYNRSTASFSYYKVDQQQYSANNNIKSMARAADGSGLWVGTYNGLNYFDTRTGEFRLLEFSGKPGAPQNKQIYALLTTPAGLWIGTNGGGLALLDNNQQYKTYSFDPATAGSLSSNNITTLNNAGNGNLWIGTERGLNFFSSGTGRFTSFTFDHQNPYSISNNSVRAVFTDSGGKTWIGTKRGLNLYDKARNRFYTIGENYGLHKEIAHAIQEDNAGNLWVSTNKGLFKISFLTKTRLPIAATDIAVIKYTVSDGLQSNQFSSCSEKGRNGELFFGGINGLTIFNPEQVKENTFMPDIVLTDFMINNKAVSINASGSPLQKSITETSTITLKHAQAFFTIKFAALNYINAEKNQYAYILEGFANDDWHYNSNQRSATYTNLDAGTYLFKVRAANNDGVWSDKTATLQVVVLPPWYKTWWAYLLYTAVAGTLLYLFYYYSIKTAKLKNELVFEHMSREKEQELAQRKLTFFTNISHEIKTPLTLILAPIEKLLGMNEGNNKVQNHLMLMQRNGERLLQLINQLLDFRKFESDSMKLKAAEGNMVRFVREVLAAFESLAAHKQIKLGLEAESKKIRVWFDRDLFEKVLYNLLSNSLKFTPVGGRITVRVKTIADAKGSGPGNMLLEVEDNGTGIAEQHLPHIFEQFRNYNDAGLNKNGTGIGLSFTKGLVELHHGQITVESAQVRTGREGFTKFTVKLPLGSSHLSEEEIIANYSNSEDIRSYTRAELATVSHKLQQKKQQVLAESEKEKPILLLVEDNPEVLEFVAAHFAEELEVHTATDGEQGWEKAIALIPDIIISDVMMPGIPGTVLCERLKSDVRTSHIPVILLTARTPLIFKIEGLETGADDYISKPFNLSLLEARVWNLLESRQKLRERYSKEITLQPVNVAITSPDEIFLEKVMKYIENNLCESNLSVEELGREIGMSRVTLYRKIKALTNKSTIEFIRSVRISRAAQLLEQKKFNISEVAYMTGFTDIDYFRKCFKEQYGYTPTGYIDAMAKI